MNMKLTLKVCLFIIFIINVLNAQSTDADAKFLLSEGAFLRFYAVKADSLPRQTDESPAFNAYVMKGVSGMFESNDFFVTLSSKKDDQSSAWTQKGYLVYEYQIIASGNRDDRDWLSKGAYLMMRHNIVRPDVNRDSFDLFIRNTWSPVRSDAVPDTKLIFLKATGGQTEGKYAFIWIFPSTELKIRYVDKFGYPTPALTSYASKWSWLHSDEYLNKYLIGDAADAQGDLIITKNY